MNYMIVYIRAIFRVSTYTITVIAWEIQQNSDLNYLLHWPNLLDQVFWDLLKSYFKVKLL